MITLLLLLAVAFILILLAGFVVIVTMPIWLDALLFIAFVVFVISAPFRAAKNRKEDKEQK